MEKFYEQTIRRSSGEKVADFLFVLFWSVFVLALVGLLIGFTLLFSVISVQTIGFTALMAIVAFYFFVKKDTFQQEMDYAFNNGELEVARVFRGVRRKQELTVAVDRLHAAGWADGPQAARYLNQPGVVKHNLYLNKDARLYFLLMTAKKDQKKHLVLIEPSDEMVSYIRAFLARGVDQD